MPNVKLKTSASGMQAQKTPKKINFQFLTFLGRARPMPEATIACEKIEAISNGIRWDK